MTLEQIYQEYVQRQQYTWEETNKYKAPSAGQLLFVQTHKGDTYRFVFFKGDEPYIKAPNRWGDTVDTRLFNFFATYKGQDYHYYQYILLTPPQ